VSKARKAKILRGSMRQTVVEPREKAATKSAGGGRAEGRQEECWDFRLIDTTQLAAQAANGVGVSGSIVRGRVAVSASFGLIGFAPPGIGQKIIIALQVRPGSFLAGAVKSSGTTTIPPSVRICYG
jgi:hypothetical protein